MMIREAMGEDYLAIHEIVKEGHLEHVEAIPWMFRDTNDVMPIDYYDELMANNNVSILVDDNDQDILGFAVIEVMASPPFPSLTQRNYLYIHDFGVKSSAQRMGIGRKLFKACQQFAKERNCESIELNVWAFNERAIHFYEKIGMEPISQKMRLVIEKG